MFSFCSNFTSEKNPHGTPWPFNLSPQQVFNKPIILVCFSFPLRCFWPIDFVLSKLKKSAVNSLIISHAVINILMAMVFFSKIEDAREPSSQRPYSK